MVLHACSVLCQTIPHLSYLVHRLLRINSNPFLMQIMIVTKKIKKDIMLHTWDWQILIEGEIYEVKSFDWIGNWPIPFYCL